MIIQLKTVFPFYGSQNFVTVITPVAVPNFKQIQSRLHPQKTFPEDLFSPTVNWPGREAYYSQRPTADVMNPQRYASIRPHVFIVLYLTIGTLLSCTTLSK